MIIAKFGGTSVSGKKQIATICHVVKSTRNIVVVVSALSNITDLLISLSRTAEKERYGILSIINNMHCSLIDELWKGKTQTYKQYIHDRLDSLEKNLKGKLRFSAQELDHIVANGEIMSSYILTEFLKTTGISAQQIIGNEIIITDNNYGSADFLPKPTMHSVNSKIRPLLDQNITPIITGFIGRNLIGDITTLGRGGSDYSASIIAYCLKAKEIQIWTDVNGVLTGDPRIIKTVKTIDELTYEKAELLSLSGAKVIHPRTIKPAQEALIPIRVLNTFNPTHKGTIITNQGDMKKNDNHIIGIAHKNDSDRRVSISIVGNDVSKQLLNIKYHLDRYEDIVEIPSTHNLISVFTFSAKAKDATEIANELHSKLLL